VTDCRDAVLVIDVGMTNCKAVLFDYDGAILASAGRPYPTSRPEPGFAEQSPHDWWDAAVGAMRQLAGMGSQLERVRAIGVTGHMHALVCLDPAGRPLGPSLVLGDHRAVTEAEEITKEVGHETVLATTGTVMDASMPAAKIRWLWRHRPELWGRTSCFVGCKDYVRLLLTGELATEPVDACAFSLYDIRRRSWSEPLMAAARVRPNTLPPIFPPQAVAGPLVPGAAEALGVPAGVPVIVGAGDDVEVLGNGLVDAGAALEHLGTTGSILAVIPEPVGAVDESLELYPHAIEGLWVVGASMTTAGEALDWARRALGYGSLDEASGCLAMWPLAEDAPLFLPHLAGLRSPTREPFARGAWIGMHPETTREELMLAAYEGVSLGVRAILARVEGLLGAGTPITVSAGRSADPRWLKVRADIYGRLLAVLETPEPTALGILTLALVALGVDQGVAAAVRRVVRTTNRVEPGLAGDGIARRVAAYELLSSSLQSAWPVLAIGRRACQGSDGDFG
jgi:xylulokinase